MRTLLALHSAPTRRSTDYPERGATLYTPPQPPAPLRRQLTARRRDADEHGRRAQGEPLREVRHHRDAAAEAEHVLDGLAALRPIEHRHDPLGEVADAGVRGLRRERAELPVRHDQKAVLAGLEHHPRGVRCSPVARNTAGSRWPVSPYTSACTTVRSTTVATT